VKHWLPGEPVTAETMAEAMWLDKRHWENLSAAVTNGIAKAFNG
jgi:hypothetical protein